MSSAEERRPRRRRARQWLASIQLAAWLLSALALHPVQPVAGISSGNPFPLCTANGFEPADDTGDRADRAFACCVACFGIAIPNVHARTGEAVEFEPTKPRFTRTEAHSAPGLAVPPSDLSARAPPRIS